MKFFYHYISNVREYKDIVDHIYIIFFYFFDKLDFQ
jgi:hypothetical protein